MEKRNTLVFVVLITIVISIVLLITYIKANGNSDEKTMKCIASKSLLIASRTCSACAYQKQILGDYYTYFKTIDVIDNPEVWEEYSLEGVPAWVIDEKTYPGVKTLKELKELTGC